MNNTELVAYESPTISVVEVKTESSVLTTSNYDLNPYYEE